MISSGGSDGGAGGSGSVPNRRTLCSSVGGGVSGPCVSCASALPALSADTKMTKTKNAKARVIRRSRRRFARSETESRKAGPKDLHLEAWQGNSYRFGCAQTDMNFLEIGRAHV